MIFDISLVCVEVSRARVCRKEVRETEKNIYRAHTVYVLCVVSVGSKEGETRDGEEGKSKTDISKCNVEMGNGIGIFDAGVGRDRPDCCTFFFCARV